MERLSSVSPPRGRSRSSVRRTLEDISMSVYSRHFSRFAIGIILLLAVVLLWTCSNFVTQDLYAGGFEKPFLVTYLNTSAFAGYLIPVFVRKYFRQSKTPFQEAASGYAPIPRDPEDNEGDHASMRSLPPLTNRETVDLAASFCVLWFIANWSVNASLDYTSVASTTILSSTSGFFTMGLGVVFGVERLNASKVGAVISSFFGVLLVSLSDAHSSSGSVPMLGDALALLSATFYALYVILLKVRIKYEQRIDMQAFFAFVGVFNIIGGIPVIFLLHITGLETFELPHSGKATAALLINMAITWSSDYLYVLAMLKTTPLVVTVGLSLTIPFAVAGDFFILDKSASWLAVGGAFLVLVSFVVLGLADGTHDVETNEELGEGVQQY